MWLSVASIWEAVIKQQTGRIAFPSAAWAYLTAQRERHGIASLDLTERALSHLDKLPDVHRDPFDRVLVCQAIEHQLTVVTSDGKQNVYSGLVFVVGLGFILLDGVISDNLRLLLVWPSLALLAVWRFRQGRSRRDPTQLA